MRRHHLFEFEDQRWFPPRLRDAVTDFLQRGLVLGTGVYEPVAPLVNEMLRSAGTNRIIDLCSGASGPWAQLQQSVFGPDGTVVVTLTDKFPNHDALAKVAADSHGRVTYSTEPVDATAVPDHLEGVRTMFTAFHHFGPEAAASVLKDSVESGAPIAVFEFTERRWKTVLMTPLIGPVVLARLTWQTRPRSLGRMLLTFLFPVLPLIVVWDGVVSNLRTYEPKELEGLAGGLGGDGYVWRAGKLASPDVRIPITYLIGEAITPRSSAAHAVTTSVPRTQQERQ